MNRVFLQGNLTRAPQLRYTPSGVAVADFGLAVNRSFRDRDGQLQDETCFVEILCVEELALEMHGLLKLGMPTLIAGRLKQERWQTRKGEQSRLKVVAETIQLLSESSPEGPEGPSDGEFELPDIQDPF